MSKIAFWEAGFVASHLSRPSHGFAASQRAVRWLNPIWTTIEERYVRERVVMEPGREIAALRELRGRLKGNGIVSSSVGDEAERTVTVPMLGGELQLASGPMTLAAVSGAPLLPVFTIRRAAGDFEVEIQPPLEHPAGAKKHERLLHVARQYARRLEPYVQEYAGQWLG